MTNYAELRAALDAGPKPGPWVWKQVGSFTTPGCAVFWPDTNKVGVHYRRLDSGGGMEQVDADFIAACHPAVIRALLAERDALREALRWTAGALQASCVAGKVAEADTARALIGNETKSIGQILDAADAALAQGDKK